MSEKPSLARFPPNTTLVSAAINQRIVVSCYEYVTYSNYPNDIHHCKIRMKSYYANATLTVNIKKGNERFYRAHDLSGFTISNSKIPESTPKVSSGSGIKYTEFGVKIKLERRFDNYVYQYYLPCTLIVSASTLSFVIPLSAMPGRVALVVTLFLTLTNMLINERVNLIKINLFLLYIEASAQYFVLKKFE